ncbi:hypothetical protein AZE42_00762 [Rhizopogon vesiculosus]|uniref:Uncharacterized protein n=1 Tax=Rhizopogon vesiculosus TaxID=180088 RepID=A0A1J8PZW5_9AGAM|nr:hypothetical protein AZE42_00762 [Rhizopogon vesiculosus]
MDNKLQDPDWDPERLQKKADLHAKLKTARPKTYVNAFTSQAQRTVRRHKKHLQNQPQLTRFFNKSSTTITAPGPDRLRVGAAIATPVNTMMCSLQAQVQKVTNEDCGTPKGLRSLQSKDLMSNS